MDQETAIQICGLIAGVLSADEDMHPHEASFLQRVRQRFALPKGARVTPVVDPARAVEELAGMAEDVRGEAFDLLVQAAAADGKIAPAERTFLSALADSLGVSLDALDERLQSELATSKPQPFGLASSRDDDD